MSTALGLAMQISANTAQLGTAVQDINKRLDQMADSGKKAANDLGVLKNLEIAKAFIAGITAVANGLMKAASGAKQLFNDSREAIDEIGKLSSATGLSVESIQQLQLVAAESGASTDRLAKSVVRLQAEIGVGATDVDKMNKKFEKLGLTYADLGKLSPEQQFERVADAVAAIEDPAERAAAVNQIFGTRGAQEFVNTLALGGDRIRELREEAAELGATIGDDAIRAVETMNDRLGRVAFAFDNIVKSVTTTLAPVVTKLTERLLATIKDLGVQNIGQFIGGALLTFADNFLAGLAFIVDTILAVADQIRKAIDLIPGVDLQTADEKELEALLKRQELAERLNTSTGRSRVSVGRQLQSAGGVLSDADLKRLAELQSGQGGLRESSQQFFAAARDGIKEGLSFLDAQPEADVAGQVAEGTATGNADFVAAVNANTRAQERNAAATVEIPR